MTLVSLRLFDANQTVLATVSADFDPDEIQLLNSFASQMMRVKNTTLLQRGFSGACTMRWNANEGVILTREPCSDTELHELLHVIRPVILVKERTSFEKILGLLGRKFKNKDFANYANDLRQVFKEGSLSRYMQVQIQGKKLFSSSILNLWLNGTQYHTDQEKAERWSELEAILSEENARALVIGQLYSKVEALLRLDDIVRLILQKPVPKASLDNQ